MSHYPVIYLRVVERDRSSLLWFRQSVTRYELLIDQGMPEVVDFKGLVDQIAAGRGNNDVYEASSAAVELFKAGDFETWVNYPGLGTRKLNLPQ